MRISLSCDSQLRPRAQRSILKVEEEALVLASAPELARLCCIFHASGMEDARIQILSMPPHTVAKKTKVCRVGDNSQCNLAGAPGMMGQRRSTKESGMKRKATACMHFLRFVHRRCS
mmetsp:Transcript_16258/g.44145  ORF Transcript_16258/g.44145 Transcript_16258/m.44145 type:complete len:117 (-) Transcript_16258:26-376(-)